ncbi:VOC family protein [Synechococcus elongatus]|uniref:VOC family protein n=1 Tax=Synechococcus elongatus PCC 11801 TaxID=2219813 RepID=A0AAN1QPR9_SYNEL|nr:VOC family protein [Synechococcus elongatus]AZB73136.1 VOC family protein [Synechococcus elongatus PCC 11801]
MHHVSIRTANIHRAIAFYELLGFQVCERFTAGYTLACWMEGLGGRIELLQVPQPQPAADAFHDEHYTGYYHLSFDLTEQTPNLSQWLDGFQARLQAQGEDLAPVLLTPRQQQIGSTIYEVMFLADRDGLPLEFLRLQARLASSD